MNHLRMTVRQKDGSYELLDPDQIREAVQRLGQAEDALESLTEQYHSMEAKLESQRNQGRGTRSAVFNRMLAEKLMLSLRKTYTVASGLKYQFWILLPDVMDEESLKLELQKIQKIFEEPVADNFTEHDISASIGVSVFPEPGSSAKKLIEQTILSIQKAQKEGGRRMQIFGI